MGLWDAVGALLITYFASRFLLLVVRSRSLIALAALHAASFGLLLVITGLAHANRYTHFDTAAASVFILPQLLWLAYDCGLTLRFGQGSAQ